MNCQRCGDVNPPGAAFCLNCGCRFEATASASTPPSNLKRGMSVAALFLGIMNLFLFGLFGVGAIAGIIVGFIALSKIRKAPTEYGGKGMAMAGLAMSGLSVILSFVAIIAAVSIPAILQKRTVSRETVILMDIKTVVQAEEIYKIKNGKYAGIKELVESQDLSEYWGNELVNTYRFRVNADDSAFEIFATPSRYGPGGRRSFYTSSLNLDKEIPVIHGADKGGAEANSRDPILDY
jgi:hypothetical protein